MEITGQLNEIIYQNEINGYTIATLETDKEEITVVGYLPFINIGDNLKLIGKYVTHQEYGEQFKIETFEKVMPQTLSALEKYLSNGIIKGIGPSTAKKIVNTFGEETISIFKFEPEKLATIRGITKEKALLMSEEFNQNWELWQIVGFLEKFGIAVSNAKKIYKLLGVDAVRKIEEEPYILVDIARGVDFKKIDKMALDIGIPLANENRIKSGIKYSLIRVSYNGHTCVLEENLIQFVQELLGIDADLIQDKIVDLKVTKEIVVEEREDGKKWVYLAPFFKAEENIANNLIALQNAPNMKEISNFKKELKNIEKNSEIKLSDKQKEAIEAINSNNVCYNRWTRYRKNNNNKTNNRNVRKTW